MQRWLAPLILTLALPLSAEPDLQPGTPLRFVVIQTTVQRQGVEVSGKHPQERRWYISELVPVPQDIPSYRLTRVADEYFEAQVVAPLKRQGIELRFYESDIQINDGAVYALNTEQDAQECRQKAIEDHKGHGGNIFFFTWSMSPETPAQPRLVHRDKSQPLYEPKKKP